MVQECDIQSKVGYATVSRKLAQHFAELDPQELAASTPAIKDGVVIADKTFGWNKPEQGSQQALVQIHVSGPPPTVEQLPSADPGAVEQA
jgi:hypothetical protein